MHHVHSLKETNVTVRDNKGSTEGYGVDSDYSETQGGCFQEKIYDDCGLDYSKFVSCETRYTTDGGEYWAVSASCPRCGTVNGYQIPRGFPDQRSYNFHCTGKVFKGYKANCGFSTGQIIKAEIIY